MNESVVLFSVIMVILLIGLLVIKFIQRRDNKDTIYVPEAGELVDRDRDIDYVKELAKTPIVNGEELYTGVFNSFKRGEWFISSYTYDHESESRVRSYTFSHQKSGSIITKNEDIEYPWFVFDGTSYNLYDTHDCDFAREIAKQLQDISTKHTLETNKALYEFLDRHGKSE